jgi:hypothetical protein
MTNAINILFDHKTILISFIITKYSLIFFNESVRNKK